MARFPFQYININGIPTIEVRRIVVSDTSVDFQFRPEFTMAGNTQVLTQQGGTEVTVADLTGTGVYLVYYDRFANILQLV